MAQMKKKGYLVLASGRVFQGYAFGAEPKDGSGGGTSAAAGEVVFNTSLCGYQEILTDPSYQGQIVAMTSSHVGNYGINKEDVESRKLFLSGFIVQEESAVHSNYRATYTLHEYLAANGVPGLTGVDVRALTRYLRSQGAVNGIISTDGRDLKGLIKKAKAVPSMDGVDMTRIVTSQRSYAWKEGSGEWKESMMVKKPAAAPKKKKVVVMDFGVKQNILRCLVDMNCDVSVVPANTTAYEIMNEKPDGILLSNGPGDPAAVKDGVKTIQDLIGISSKAKKDGEKVPAMFGICLGHQLLGLALGGKTYKLKFGHHGANHPIKDLETGRVDITTQNHGFCVAAEKSAKGELTIAGNKDVLVTHVNLNDDAIEGMRHKNLPIFSVQYHPEAASGPHDARHLFNRFLKLMDN